MRLLPLNSTAKEEDDDGSGDDVESPPPGGADKDDDEDDDDDDGSAAAFDLGVVRGAVADAGRHAHGVVMVEVWLLTGDQTRLYRPEPYGWWVDPVFARSSGDETRERLARLVDPSRSDYLPASSLAIGEGLAGLLWVEAQGLRQGRAARTALAKMRRGHPTATAARRQSARDLQDPAGGGGGEEANQGGAAAAGGAPPAAADSSSAVFFRNVNQISLDPDQPYSPRLQLVAEIGLGWCAAVPLPATNAAQGIVLFLARSHVSLRRLQSPANREYLAAAARFAGAAIDLRGPRREAERARRRQVRDAWRRVRDRLGYLRKMGVSLADAVAQSELENKQHRLSMRPDLRQSLHLTLKTTKHLGLAFSQRAAMALRKGRGGGGTPPPAMGAFQACYAFAGAFATLTLLHALNQWLAKTYNAGIALGPFGALVTLLYCLSSAPASQPRNAVAGQVLSIAVGLGFGRATQLPAWLRVNLATSLAVSLMAKLGVIHPPAGGSAFTFASGPFGWRAVVVYLVGVVVSILAAVLINNWSVERQYPIYWFGLKAPCLDRCCGFASRRRKDAEPASKKV